MAKQEKESGPRMWAIAIIVIMVSSTLGYAILSKPSTPNTRERQENAEPQLPTQGSPSPSSMDSDSDGLEDSLEKEIGSDPYTPDTPESLKALKEEARNRYMEGELALEDYRAEVEKIDRAMKLLK